MRLSGGAVPKNPMNSFARLGQHGVPLSLSRPSCRGRHAGGRLLAGLSPPFPRIRTVIAAVHESRKLARELLRNEGWKLQSVKRSLRAFKIIGLTWFVEGSLPGWAAIVGSAKTTNIACTRTDD